MKKKKKTELFKENKLLKKLISSIFRDVRKDISILKQ